MNMEKPVRPLGDLEPRRNLEDSYDFVTPDEIEREKDKYIGKYVGGYKGRITNIFHWGNDEVKIVFDEGEQPLFAQNDPRPLTVSDSPLNDENF